MTTLLTILIVVYALTASATLIICDAKLKPDGRSVLTEILVILTVIFWPIGSPIFLYFCKQREK